MKLFTQSQVKQKLSNVLGITQKLRKLRKLRKRQKITQFMHPNFDDVQQWATIQRLWEFKIIAHLS